MKRYKPIYKKQVKEGYDTLNQFILDLRLPGYCDFQIFKSMEDLYFIETNSKFLNNIAYINKNYTDYRSVTDAALKAITSYITAHNYFSRPFLFKIDRLAIKFRLKKIINFFKEQNTNKYEKI